MKFTFKTVVAAVVGATAFAHGTHSAASHAEEGLIGWYLTALGGIFLLLVAIDVVEQFRLVRRSGTPDGDLDRLEELKVGEVLEAIAGVDPLVRFTDVKAVQKLLGTGPKSERSMTTSDQTIVQIKGDL